MAKEATVDQKAIMNIIGARAQKLIGVSAHEWVELDAENGKFILLCEHTAWQGHTEIPLPQQFRYDIEIPLITDSHKTLAESVNVVLEKDHDSHLDRWFNTLSDEHKSIVAPAYMKNREIGERHNKTFPSCCELHRQIAGIFGFDPDNLPEGWNPKVQHDKLDRLLTDIMKANMQELAGSMLPDIQSMMQQGESEEGSEGQQMPEGLRGLLDAIQKAGGESNIQIIGGNIEDAPSELRDMLKKLMGGKQPPNQQPEQSPDNDPDDIPDWLRDA